MKVVLRMISLSHTLQYFQLFVVPASYDIIRINALWAGSEYPTPCTCDIHTLPKLQQLGDFQSVPSLKIGDFTGEIDLNSKSDIGRIVKCGAPAPAAVAGSSTHGSDILSSWPLLLPSGCGSGLWGECIIFVASGYNCTFC